MFKMDPYMFLSIINMKLRDEFEGLSDLCSTLDLEEKEVKDKLKIVGYSYNKETNQFTDAEK